MAVISSLLIRLGVSEGSVTRGFKKAREEVDKFERKINQSGAAINKLGKAGTNFGIGPAIVAATGALTSFVGAAAPAVNTALALPAALAQIGAAAVTLKLGLNGVGKAIGDVADGSAASSKELAKLGPDARRFALTTGNAIQTVRKATQTALFTGWTKEFDKLARDQTPLLAKGLGAVAVELGSVARAGVQAAGTPLVSGVVREVFAGTALDVHALADATPSLVSGLAAVVKVGNPLITTLVQAGLNAAKNKAAWLASADGIAWMNAKIDEGRVTFGKLVSITQHLGATLLHVLGGARLSTGDLLGRIDELAARMDRWSASVEGQGKIIAFFDRAREVGVQMGEAFNRVIDVALKLADGFNKLPQPMQDGILTASAYAIVLGPLVTRFSSLIAIMLQIGVAAVRGGAGIVKFMFFNQTAAGGTRAAWVATRVQVLAIWLQLQAQAAASAARTAVAWTASSVRVAAAWLVLQGQAVALSARIAAVWIAQWARQAAAAAVSMATTVGTVVGGWVVMAAQSLAQAARMAASWLIAMGPVGIVIAIIVALVFLIIKNWDTIVEWTKKAWEWVWSKGIKPAVDFALAIVNRFISDVKSVWSFFTTGLPNIIRSGFTEANAIIADKISAIVNWFIGLPGRILGAISGFNTQMHQWGVDLVQGAINGLSDAVGRLVAKAREVASAAMQAIKDALGIGSPSKITRYYMIMVGKGGVIGGQKMIKPLARTGERMADAAMRPWNALGRTAPFTLDWQVRSPTPSYPGFGRGDDPTTGAGGSDRSLVSIGTYNAGGQTPEETARSLDYAARRR